MNKFFLWLVTTSAIFIIAAAAHGRAIDRTIAKLNDDILTESDLAQVIAELRGEHHSAGIDAFAEATSATVGALFDRTLLLQEARRLQVRPSAEELHRQVEDTVREVRDNFVSDKEFYQALAQERLSLDQFKEQLLKQTRDDYMVYHVVDSRFSVSDADVARYKQQESESPHVKLRLRRLGIAITKKVDTQQACRKARAMVAQTITDGVSFEEGVRRYSEVPGAAQDGGDMGYMPLEKLSKDVRAAVENLEVGQASAPVVAGDYANIFYVEGKRGARVAVREEKFVKARTELLKSLRRRAVLQVFDKRLLPLLPPDYAALAAGQEPRRDDGKLAGNQVQNSSSAQETSRQLQERNGQAQVIQQQAQVTPTTRQVLFAPGNQNAVDNQKVATTPIPKGSQKLAGGKERSDATSGTPSTNISIPDGSQSPARGQYQQPRHGWFGRSR